MRAFKLLLFVALASATVAHAEYGTYQHSIYGAFGFTTGGFALGADYEYQGLRDFGVGGYLRMYQKDEDHAADGVTAFGGFIRPHFQKKSWDFYVSPGLAIISIDDFNGGNPGDATTLGASLAIGLMYDLNGTTALGVENMRHWVWFEDDYRGWLSEADDFMLRFRVSF